MRIHLPKLKRSTKPGRDTNWSTQDGKDYDAYARARNQARWATRSAARDLEKNIGKIVKENPKAFWKYANSKSKSQQRVS